MFPSPSGAFSLAGIPQAWRMQMFQFFFCFVFFYTSDWKSVCKFYSRHLEVDDPSVLKMQIHTDSWMFKVKSLSTVYSFLWWIYFASYSLCWRLLLDIKELVFYSTSKKPDLANLILADTGLSVKLLTIKAAALSRHQQAVTPAVI